MLYVASTCAKEGSGRKYTLRTGEYYCRDPSPNKHMILAYC